MKTLRDGKKFEVIAHTGTHTRIRIRAHAHTRAVSAGSYDELRQRNQRKITKHTNLMYVTRYQNENCRIVGVYSILSIH
jgi:hypothetical protein